MLDSPGCIGGELEAAGLGIALDDGVEPRLMDGNVTTVQALDFTGIDIDTDHMVARICETSPGNQTDVTGAENRDTH